MVSNRLNHEGAGAAPDAPARGKKSRQSQAVRMIDVAALAGVHPSVVSRVISGDENLLVRPETRERVVNAIQRLGYRPNLAARMLKTSRAKAIGLVIPDFANAAYAQIAIGAERRANEAGYILLVASGTVQTRLSQLSGRIDGLLYAIAVSDSATETKLPDDVPCLLVNRSEPHLGHSVVGNDEHAAYVATKHLIELGHTRIAHMVATPSLDTGRRRTAGYLRAMSEAGLAVPLELAVESGIDEEAGYRAALTLLNRDPRPTAIVVASARWSMGTVAACETLGVDIPGDVSIVAFSDAPFDEYLRPRLTTVRLPLQEMGEQATDVLLHLIDGEDVSDVVLDDPPLLVVRDSTAPPR